MSMRGWDWNGETVSPILNNRSRKIEKTQRKTERKYAKTGKKTEEL